MSIIEAVIIAIVEGITEFLPVSSTGHMIITQELLGMTIDDFVKAFTVNIQFGAILSVIVLYWKRFFQSLQFYYKLMVAFIPAGIIGFLAMDFIDSMLGSVLVVAIMLVLGGVVLLFVDKWFAKAKDTEIKYMTAFKIGLFQCIAIDTGCVEVRSHHYRRYGTGTRPEDSGRVFILPCRAYHVCCSVIQAAEEL